MIDPPSPRDLAADSVRLVLPTIYPHRTDYTCGRLAHMIAHPTLKMSSDGPFARTIVVDGKGHLLGRLASIVAKQLLSGQRIVIVRAEEAVVSGTLFRNKFKYLTFLRKRVNTNPRRGPFHHRSPSKILHRAIRGMSPHKSKRGALALKKLKIFEGCPAPFDKKKKQVVPDALAVVRLRPGRPTTKLGDLAAEVGWKYKNVVAALEAKRKAKGKVFHEQRKKALQLRNKAVDNKKTDLAPLQQSLAQLGH